ncbi:shikimate 5-dehydrogenase [Thiovulum sp. ES]|nr:shikimate 5-dehydrogenase [Thiovulum sp. ES]
MIDKQTLLFGLLDEMATSSPIPNIYNSVFENRGVNARYVPMNIRDDDILFTLKGIKSSQISGINLGEIFQKDGLEMLSESSEDVKFSGFVETIKVVNGELHGSNSTGRAIAKTVSGKVAIFGVSEITKSIIFNSDAKITLLENEIEKTLPILEKFPNLDVKLSDETHPFDLSNFDFAIFGENEIFTIGDAKQNIDTTKLSDEVLQKKAEIDTEEWL